MTLLLILGGAIGVIGVFLLATASGDTAVFARHYPLILALNAVMAMLLAGLVGYQLGAMARRYRARAAREEFLRQVQYVSPGNLTLNEHLSADLLEYELKTALEAEASLDLVQQVSQSDGLHNEVFEIVDQMPARTVRDYENIIVRLRALPRG